MRCILFTMSFRRLLPLLAVLVFALAASAQTPAPAKSVLTPAEVRRRDAVAWYLKGRLHLQENEYEEAVKAIRKAIELDPDDGSLHGRVRRASPGTLDLRRGREGSPEGGPALAGRSVGTADSRRRPSSSTRRIEPGSRRPQPRSGRRTTSSRASRPGRRLTRRRSSGSVSRRKRSRCSRRVLDRGRGPSVPLLYGEALEKSGRFGDAEDVFLSVLRIDPENRAASLGLLRVYERGGSATRRSRSSSTTSRRSRRISG